MRKKAKLAFLKKDCTDEISFGKKYSDATTCPTNSNRLSGFDDEDSDDEDDEYVCIVADDHDSNEIGQFQPPPGLSPPTAPPGKFTKSDHSSVLHVHFACDSDLSTKDSDDALSSIASCEEEASDGTTSVVDLDDDENSVPVVEPMKVHLPPPPPPGLNAPGCPPGSFGANVSVGSSLHASGQCRPCAWFYKPGGCKNGTACRHCHTCPEGSVKALKRGKVALLKAGYSPSVMPTLRANHLIS